MFEQLQATSGEKISKIPRCGLTSRFGCCVQTPKTFTCFPYSLRRIRSSPCALGPPRSRRAAPGTSIIRSVQLRSFFSYNHRGAMEFQSAFFKCCARPSPKESTRWQAEDQKILLFNQRCESWPKLPHFQKSFEAFGLKPTFTTWLDLLPASRADSAAAVPRWRSANPRLPPATKKCP